MRKLSVLLLAITFTAQLNGQSLLETYKTGKTTFEPVAGFSQGTNWSDVFPDYNLASEGNAIGRYKSIAIAPDGSIFIGNYSSYSIQKFNPEGKLLFSFGQKGKTEGDFKERPILGGVVGNKYVFTYEHNGNIKLFTLDGKYNKTIKIDYMPIKAIATATKIAIVGHVPMNGSVRNVVTVIDPETENQKIIKKYDNLWEKPKLTIKKGDLLVSCAPLFNNFDIFIRPLPNGNILIGVNNSKTIEECTSDGIIKNSFNLDFSAPSYPEEMKKVFIANLEKKVSENKFSKEDIAPIYKDDFFPKSTPYYYNIIIDSDGNLLVFRYIDEDVDHKFNVYHFSSNGKILAESTLDIPNYALSLNYRFEELAFFKGNAYGILNSSDEEPKPAQLIKFNVKIKK